MRAGDKTCRSCGMVFNADSMNCVSCESVVFHDDNFCESCAYPIKQTHKNNQTQTQPKTLHLMPYTETSSDEGSEPKNIFCTECGNKLPVHAKFCDLCGFRSGVTR